MDDDRMSDYDTKLTFQRPPTNLPLMLLTSCPLLIQRDISLLSQSYFGCLTQRVCPKGGGRLCSDELP